MTVGSKQYMVYSKRLGRCVSCPFFWLRAPLTQLQTSHTPKRLPSARFEPFSKKTRDRPSLTVDGPLVYLKRFLGANTFGLHRNLANVGGGKLAQRSLWFDGVARLVSSTTQITAPGIARTPPPLATYALTSPMMSHNNPDSSVPRGCPHIV